MSIIQEALKKAQDNYTERKSPVQAKEILAEAAAPKPIEVIHKFSVNKSVPRIIYIIALLALVTGFGIRTIFVTIASNGKDKISQTLAPADHKPAPATIASGSAERATDKLVNFVSAGLINRAPDLILNGIMYVEERPKAIINGTVVTEGDVISGATVTSIKADRALVKSNNSDNKVEMALTLKECLLNL